jgi:hypothetical protein
MMELQVHLRQRLLHVLNVSRGVFQQPFPLAQTGSQNRDLALRLETAAQQAVGVQSLEPLNIADVGLAVRNVSARRCRSPVNVPKLRTGSALQSGATAVICLVAPMSIAAALG